MADDDVLLNYHNSLLRQSDVKLLQNADWLNDQVIGFWFEYLENSTMDNSVCLVCPEVTQFIKLGSPSDTPFFVDPLNLSQRALVLFPVNDSMFLDHPGGSHWSLLVYAGLLKKYYHLDSLIGTNLGHAKKIANNLHLPNEEVVELKCTQQENSYDCGVFVCSNAENVIRHHLVNKGMLVSLPMLNLEFMNKQRSHMLQVILTLSCK
ncbi:sentrin-specific protease 8-like [Daphnia carinata]|uniref:sentrin-specific protease 8-like n=1 Tax=Daphnia carinata TaxID=120202 RepID=UPI00257FC309|nr:sentrin-specific protease 8-like [Daphnia carinata]XP_057364929.1 sentrin-specific protease 8-like [Daphnia carinata]